MGDDILVHLGKQLAEIELELHGITDAGDNLILALLIDALTASGVQIILRL